MKLACRRKNRTLFLTYMYYIFIPYWNAIGYRLADIELCGVLNYFDIPRKLKRLKENILDNVVKSKFHRHIIGWFINFDDSKYLYSNGLTYQVRNRARDCRYYILKYIPIPFCNYFKLIEQRWVDIKNPQQGINSYSLGICKLVNGDFDIPELIEQQKVLFEGNINTYAKLRKFLKTYKEAYISVYKEDEI